MTTQVIIKTENDLKQVLAKEYMVQIQNFFGDKNQALKFLSSVMSAVQRTPTLLQCTPNTLINSFMTMAQLGLMPSGISGEAYVLPYRNRGSMEAQFQLGYQGLITLFYRAGGLSVRAEIVRDKDEFSYENGIVRHKVDIRMSRAERGMPIAAYAIALVNGQEITSIMNKTDIMDYGKAFSKSFTSEYSPWNEKNDPELWMWKKTVLKQLGKLLPKNETINRAIAEDNKDSIVSDRMEQLRAQSTGMTMGSLAVGSQAPETAPETIVEAEVVETPTSSPEEALASAGINAEVVQECHACAQPIRDDERQFSIKKYGKQLCRNCQKTA